MRLPTLLSILSIITLQINHSYGNSNNIENSISDYTLYFNDYIFDLSKQKDWDTITKTESCTFPISSIQKRVCIHNQKNHNTFKIKFKSLNRHKISSSKSPYYNTIINWNNNEDWNEISHLLSPNSLTTKNNKYISSAHSNLYSNYYGDYGYYTDPDDDPFTSDMYDTLAAGNTDESYYTPHGFNKQQAIQQLQHQTRNYIPQPKQPQPQYGRNYVQRYGSNMQYTGGMAQMSGYPPTHPMTGNTGINPQIQQLIQKDPSLLQRNPQLLSQLQQGGNCGNCNGMNTALLEQLLRKDIANNNGKKRHETKKHRSINPMISGRQGMMEWMMQQQEANRLKDMMNKMGTQTNGFMQQNNNEFKNMEKYMLDQDKKLADLMGLLKNKKGGKGNEFVELVKAMRRRGNHKGANALLAALMKKKNKGGSSYEKAYKDYLKKYHKYYKDWYKSYGPGANAGYGMQGGMGMGMGMPMGMPMQGMGMGMMSPYGMGMPMAGYGMGMGSMQPVTHVHIHHSASGAHKDENDILDMDNDIEKCKTMQGVEICGRYGNRDNVVMTVRVGMDKTIRDGDAAYGEYDDYYDGDYDYDYDSDSDYFNGRRLVNKYYDDMYDDYSYGYDEYEDDYGYGMSDFDLEDMFDYSLWKAEKIFDDGLYGEYNVFDGYKHYLNRYNFDWNDDNVWDMKYKKNMKCSKMIPTLFTRICLHYDRYNKNIKLHFDTASVNEINDILDNEYNIYNEEDIKDMYNKLKEEYNIKLNWNKDKDWNEIKTIYNHAQIYYNKNQKHSNVIEKCKHMFIASICVHGNLNKNKIGLKVNIANGKGILPQSKAKEELNNYYQYLYDNVYDRIYKQQLMAAKVAKKRNILQTDMDMV